MVDNISGTDAVQLDPVQGLIGSPDIETVMLTLGVDRANALDKAVKAQVDAMKANNAKIAELNDIKAMLAGAEDKKGKTITSDPEKLAEFQKALKDFPDLAAKLGGSVTAQSAFTINIFGFKFTIPGRVSVDKDGGLKTAQDAVQGEIDGMTNDDQLQMISLQSLVSKQNNAIDMLSTITKKFADLKDSIVRNMG